LFCSGCETERFYEEQFIRGYKRPLGMVWAKSVDFSETDEIGGDGEGSEPVLLNTLQSVAIQCIDNVKH
jgi:hypothetical protein